MDYKETYDRLYAAYTDAAEEYYTNRTKSNSEKLQMAEKSFQTFCTYILEMLMEENSDILKNLKERE